jgi:hypothetical protein
MYCKDMIDCLSNNPIYVKCITDITINSLCYVAGVISLMLQENKIKTYKPMLVTASEQIQNIALWIEKLQKYSSNLYILDSSRIGEDRRICPRFPTAGISAVINNKDYPIKDIGLKGCFIETQVPYPSGTTINLEIGINGGIPVIAVVRHCSEKGIGVEFVGIDKDKEKEFLCHMADFFFKASKSESCIRAIGD